jgi:hypothetical protein
MYTNCVNIVVLYRQHGQYGRSCLLILKCIGLFIGKCFFYVTPSKVIYYTMNVHKSEATQIDIRARLIEQNKKLRGQIV